jgi:uncharacterized protein (TIGR00661 family)
LIAHDFEPIIASDGVALDLLKKEFATLKSFELPSYNITYPKKATNFKLKLIKDAPHLLRTIKKEKEVIRSLVELENINGIISDNRFGVRHPNVPSIFITHQLRVLSGTTTWLSSKLHQSFISKFNECWVPDYKDVPNLSGDLGHPENFAASTTYLGPLSRFKKLDVVQKYKLMVLLSGPEPQRTYIEEKLLYKLKNFKGAILFVKGKIEVQQQKEVVDHMVIYNFMTSPELELAINESDLIISRSGYTTIMDLAKLEKKAFFIPTPGQFEQEYLAKKLNADGIAPYCAQDEFELTMLDHLENFTGFEAQNETVDYNALFGLF